MTCKSVYTVGFSGPKVNCEIEGVHGIHESTALFTLTPGRIRWTDEMADGSEAAKIWGGRL